MPLSESDIATHCRNLLDPVTRHIRKKMGAEAAEHAGSCLFESLRKYDASHGMSIRSWVLSKTPLLVIEAMRELDGRKGTARYAAQAARTTIEDFDASEVDHDVSEALAGQESLAAAMKTIEETSRLQRWILMGRVLGGFTNADLKGIVDVSEKQIRREVNNLRQLVSLDRLPAPVRRQHRTAAAGHV